ncbi:MAG: DUF1611 domain-containing protein [Eubacterium sp.]|nr:DUF1611 domain-containing protein [Eubacterium sp.]
MECKEYELVLLDSGFYSEESDIGSLVDVYEYHNGVWEIIEQSADEIGHGTAVLSIIARRHKGKYAVFKALSSLVDSNIKGVLSALEEIYKHMNTRYIQMSFGVRGYNKELDKICKKIYDKNTMIIAAFDNYGAISYPAAYSYVIGVSGNPYLLKKDSFIVNGNGIVDVLAKNGTQAVAAANKKGFSIQQGNSLAASYVSLFLLESGICYADKEAALRYIDANYKRKENDYKFQCLHKEVAIFPLNKEMYNLINYSDILNVTLKDVYDIKYSGQIGKEVFNLKQTESYIVKNIDKCNWDNFDTMLIGHLGEIELLLGKKLKQYILSECLAHGKNVYCYDLEEVDHFRELFHNKGLNLECADDYVKNNNYGKLYQNKTPILTVVGTGKKQGKFTLELQIMTLLRAHGIEVGALGTEPNSIFFGMDAMLPIGYGAKINDCTGQYLLEACNEQIHRIDVKEYQIIVSAAQSGFLPHYKLNSNHINIGQFAFLEGIQPDGLVLAINYRDTLEYIKKSIRLLETYTDAKVFLIGMHLFDAEFDYVIHSSKKKLKDEQIEEKRLEIWDELRLPLIVIGEEKYNDIIFDAIIQNFCG